MATSTTTTGKFELKQDRGMIEDSDTFNIIKNDETNINLKKNEGKLMKYSSSYNTDVNEEGLSFLKSQLNILLQDQFERVRFTTTNVFTKQCLELAGSVLSFTFSEYLTNNLNSNSPSVSSIENNLQKDLSERIKSFLDLKGDFFVNCSLPSATSGILCSLMAVCEKGSKVLVLSENSGGHYSQGCISKGGRRSLVRELFEVEEFNLNKNHIIDYQEMEEVVCNSRPKVLLLGASSYCKLFDYKKIREIADKNNAIFISDCSHTIGLMIGNIIPHCFDTAHITISSAYKTLPAHRGGLFFTQDENILKKFNNVLTGLQVERGLNLVSCVYVGSLECMSHGYKLKMNYAIEMAKYIASFFSREDIKQRGYRPITSTDIHIVTIDCTKDIKPLFHLFKECNIDLGTCYVPGSNRYGLRFICTQAAVLNYSLEDVENILNICVKILDGESSDLQISEFKETIINIAAKYPIYKINQ